MIHSINNRLLPLLTLAFIFSLTSAVIYGQGNEVLIKNAQAAIERKDFDSALKSITQVLARQPANADALTERARVNFFKGNDREAIADADRALAANPSAAAAYVVRGAAKRRLRIAPDDVLRDLNRALELEPANSKAWYNRGMLYWDAGKTDGALTDLNRAIELTPNVADFYYSRGSLYQSLKNYLRATEDFSKTIELAPSYGNAYANRAESYYDQIASTSRNINDPQIALARADAEKALSLDARNWQALKIRALIRYYTADKAGALTDFIASYKANSSRPETVNWLLDDRNWRDTPAALQTELLKTQAEIFNARLAIEKTEFEKDYSSSESYSRLYDAYRVPEKVTKANPGVFEIRDYFKALRAKQPQNLCLILRERHSYNDNASNYETYNNIFVQALTRTIEKKDSRCAAEMAMGIARYNFSQIEASSGQEIGIKRNNAAKWAARANELVPGYADNFLQSFAKTVSEKNAESTARSGQGSNNTGGGRSPGGQPTGSAEENALILEYNRLTKLIPDLERQQRGLEKKVANYVSADGAARIFMYRGVYNSCNSVIDSHQAFIGSLENLRKRAAGKSSAVVSQIDSQIRSVKTSVEKLVRIRKELPIGQ